MRDTFVAVLTDLAARDPRIMLLTADLGFGVLDGFARSLPRQYVNVGVAEQNMAAVAVGLALEGHIVFTYSIANFPTLRCLEQLRNDACYHNSNVKVISMGAGFSYGPLGMSHHATEDVSILRALPGMTVISPCDNWEVAQATKALVESVGPAVLRLDKSVAEVPPSARDVFEIGKARTLRDGHGITLVASGGIMTEVLAAADMLATDGIICRVLSMHTVKPIDGESLEQAARETAGIVTVEEHALEGGLGSAVAEHLLERGVHPRAFHRIGLRNTFCSAVGSQAYLRSLCGLDAAAIAAAIRTQTQALSFIA